MTSSHVRYRLPRLARLTDAQLHALLVRVQTLLLDRPNDDCMALRVDLLHGDEGHLLALYRALPPARRRAALAWAERPSPSPWPRTAVPERTSIYGSMMFRHGSR